MVATLHSMAGWSDETWSRRQFLGGMAVSAVALAFPPVLGGFESQRASAQVVRPDRPAGSARTTPLPPSFSDDFRRELPGSQLWRWETPSGVLVLGTTSFGTHMPRGRPGGQAGLLRGRGIVVTLERGPGTVAGRMRTRDRFVFEAGRSYRLELVVAGTGFAERSAGPAAVLRASVPGAGEHWDVRLPPGTGWRCVALEFDPARRVASPVELSVPGAPGSGALLIDSVRLSEAA